MGTIADLFNDFYSPDFWEVYARINKPENGIGTMFKDMLNREKQRDQLKARKGA